MARHGTGRSNTTLLDLPDEATFLLAHFLSAPDVLSLLSSHSTLYRNCGQSCAFWRGLKSAHFLSRDSLAPDTLPDGSNNAESNWKREKDEYMLQAHCDLLPTVRWRCAQTHSIPSAREGHLCCQLGDFVILTGGYSDDNAVYAKNIHDSSGTWRPLQWANSAINEDLEWVYGASLTALDERRAVRFGGFRSGGYANQTDQLAILHFDAARWTAHWEIASYRQEQDGVVMPEGEEDMMWTFMKARAYHSAALLAHRYLFIVGGMQANGSLLIPLLLDCTTWTWYVDGLTTPASAAESSGSPSSRHGCSLIWDPIRDRLVLLGGGNGSDLLRSGTDNTEVWALNMSGFSVSCRNEPNVDVHATLPWQWECLHADQTGNEAAETDRNAQPNRLSLVETLNLGRCHGAHRVSRNKVLLFGGSGRPTTNGVLGYDLARDEFFRPNVSESLVPRARFTFASAFVEPLGYVLVHGGFSNQNDDSEAISDTIILDLAPTMHRRPSLHWRLSTTVASCRMVTDQDVTANRTLGGGHSVLLEIMRSLMQLDAADRPSAAASVLATSRGMNGRFAMMLSLIASGRVQLTEDGSLRSTEDMDDE
jgi:hypothetical protein